MSIFEIYAECLVFPSSVMYCELATGVHIVDYCRKPNHYILLHNYRGFPMFADWWLLVIGEILV